MENRGSGRTSAQMLAALPCSVFVWCTGDMRYPRDLARNLGCADLRLAPPSWIYMERYQGQEYSGVTVDHAAYELMGPQEYNRFMTLLREAQARVRPRVYPYSL